MSFLIICRATADITESRRVRRLEHLQYIIRHRDRISFGGALLSADAERVTGMVLALEVAERCQAEEFIRDEPYCAAGVFTQISIEAWAGRIPEPRPGYLLQELEMECRLANPGAGAG
jgi:uncharacterized protein YciI